MKPFRLFAAVLVGILTSLAGCGGATEEAGHGEPAADHHGSGDSGASEPSEKVALDGALPLPDEASLAHAGFACHDAAADSFPDQTIRTCILATTDVAVMIRMAVVEEMVVKWSMLGLPNAFPQDVSPQLDAIAATVFGLINPSDSAVPAELQVTSAISTEHWDYEQERRAVPGGGYSGYSITASNPELFENGVSADLLPAVETFPLDLDEFIETASGNGVECKLDEAMWDVASCDLGDYSVVLTTDPEAEDQLRGFWFTTYASPDRYAEQAAGMASFLSLAKSPELDAMVSEMQKRWVEPAPSWTWIGGLPVLVLPVAGPWTFSVDGTLVPGLS